MDFSSNLRYILATYRKVGSIQNTVFCYCTIFSYTDSYHPHKSLNILFFKTVHIQFHQAVHPSDKFYPSCIPYLLKGDCNISIFGGGEGRVGNNSLFFAFHYKMSSVNFFCWLHLQHWWGFHCVSKGPHTSSLHPLCFVRWWVARQKTYLQASCVLSLSWSCSLYCSSPAAGFAPEIPLGFTARGAALPLSSGGASVGVEHSLLLPGWSMGCLEPQTSALHIEPQGESEPRQSHHFFNTRHLFPTFLTACYF